MYYFLGLCVAFLAGGIVSYLVVRNNPKLLDLKKLTKEQLLELNRKIGEQLK